MVNSSALSAREAVQAVRRRVHRKAGRISRTTVYAVTSIATEQFPPARPAPLIRAHWAVEALHQV